MIVGKKYVNSAIFYTMFKKHCCPACGTKLTRIKTSKIVNSKSPEANQRDQDYCLRQSKRWSGKNYIGSCTFSNPIYGRQTSAFPRLRPAGKRIEHAMS